MGIIERKKRILLNEPHIATTTPAGAANFSTDMIAPLKSCKVEFAPVQSGSGDPSPTNIRPITGWTGVTAYQTGKNLLKNKIKTRSSTSIYIGQDVANEFPVRLVKGITYALSFSHNGTSTPQVYFNKSDSPNTAVFFGERTSSTYTAEETADVRIYIYVPSGVTSITDFQLEVGSASTYESFKSLTTIPVTFPATKNLLSPADRDDRSASNIYYNNSNPMTLTAGTYTLSISEQCSGIYVMEGNTVVAVAYDNAKLTFTLSEAKAVSFDFYKSGIDHTDTCQLEVGSSATAHEPYGTVYGGYVDFVTGELVATWRKIKFSDVYLGSWSSKFSGFILNYTLSSDPLIAKVKYNAACSAYNYVGSYTQVGDLQCGFIYNTSLIVKDSEVAGDYEAFRTKTANYEIAYELANSIHYSIPPAVLKSIIGTNNIWSTSNGNVEVKYWNL